MKEINLRNLFIPDIALQLLPVGLVKRLQVMPVGYEDGVLIVAVPSQLERSNLVSLRDALLLNELVEDVVYIFARLGQIADLIELEFGVGFMQAAPDILPRWIISCPQSAIPEGSKTILEIVSAADMGLAIAMSDSLEAESDRYRRTGEFIGALQGKDVRPIVDRAKKFVAKRPSFSKKHAIDIGYGLLAEMQQLDGSYADNPYLQKLQGEVRKAMME